MLGQYFCCTLMEVVLFLTKLLQFETGETNRIEYKKPISHRLNRQLALVRDLIDLICGSHHLNIAFRYQNSVRSQIYFDLTSNAALQVQLESVS